MDTLPDYLRPGLRVVSIGLNPSLPSVQAGFYFANPRNRFWRALNAAGLVDRVFEPSVAAVEMLFDRYAIGFTDVVKRPTRGASELRADDYRRWSPVLSQKLVEYAPRIAWVHGKVAYRQYLRYTDGPRDEIAWGLQPHRLEATGFFVTPNPSPANAAFSLEVLTDWYRTLAAEL